MLSSLGWALSQLREERQSHQCWHNLSSPWRATGTRQAPGAGGNWRDAELGAQDKQEGVSLWRNQKLPHYSRKSEKNKTPKGSPKGIWFEGEFLSWDTEPGAGHGRALATMSLQLRTCSLQTGSCCQPNATAQESPGTFNIPTFVFLVPSP